MRVGNRLFLSRQACVEYLGRLCQCRLGCLRIRQAREESFQRNFVFENGNQVWWEARRDELVQIAGKGSPVMVYDGETLNDIVFDLLCLECVDGLLFDVGLSSCPELLEALGRLGAGFQCRTPEEVALVDKIPGCIGESMVLLVPDDTPTRPSKLSLQGIIPAIPISGMTGGEPDDLRDRDVLVVLPGPVSPRTDPAVKSCLRELDRLHSRVRGVYLPWGRRFEYDEEKHKLLDWQAVAGRDGILVPARGMGIVLEGETGAPDFHGTAKSLEELKSVFPEGSIWVEPGAGFFSFAAAMVMPGKGGVRVLTQGNLRPGHSINVSLPEERFLRARRICLVPL